jgi:hypothetical protein
MLRCNRKGERRARASRAASTRRAQLGESTREVARRRVRSAATRVVMKNRRAMRASQRMRSRALTRA